jgi:hypothetical protein
MLCWILIAGGLLVMMGQHDRSEALFYYFRLEDQVPETHLLRLIENHISFAFVRERLRQSYSETGRPSIDPELLLRILLIGYLYGITSERVGVEKLSTTKFAKIKIASGGPGKRLSRIARHFLSPKFWLFETKREFFNRHSRLRSLRGSECKRRKAT